MKESIIYYTVKGIGAVARLLPLKVSLCIGRCIGLLAYYFDTKHKAQAYANLKIAFAQSKSPNEIKRITKRLFMNYGENFIELFRMPLINRERFEKMIQVEGKEYVSKSLEKGKGVIIFAMHFGSWELASLSCAMLGYPYKVFVKPQDRNTRLDELLNYYRECGGSVVISRGLGTRDFLKSLKNNEVIGMVVDQGGRDGVLVPFFDRRAAMSVGAIRMGLKSGVPICFSVIIREKSGKHRMVIHEPFELKNTGDLETDIVSNLKDITKIMENYICQYPSEYMWFYKIWKYSKEANVTILSDEKIGHLRQSETVAKILRKALLDREIESKLTVVHVEFKSDFTKKLFHFLSIFMNPFVCQGRLEMLKWILKEESFKKITSVKSDYIISTGSSVAAANYLLSQDDRAKSIVILKPGLLAFKKFNLIILPEHDIAIKEHDRYRVLGTIAAPNLVTEDYLAEQSRQLLNRFTHLQNNIRFKIGLFVGGDAKHVFVSEQQIRVLIRQIKEVSREINADILVTTSRRTPVKIEQILHKELKKDDHCPLLILANQENVPEAVGGMLSLVDIAVVSGDSISMISEAASSGKGTVVFSPQSRAVVLKDNKHKDFIDKLNSMGYILSSDVANLGRSVYDLAKNKIQTKKLNDNALILEALRFVI